MAYNGCRVRIALYFSGMMLPVAHAIMLACMLSCIVAYSDTVVSTRSGQWPDPAVWSGGAVPGPSDDIVIHHSLTIPAGAYVSVASLTVNGQLLLQSASTLELSGATPVLRVDGTLECEDGSSLAGTTAANSVFGSGSRYVHRQGPLGFVPMATWEDGSTFQISGFIDDGYINLAHSAGWRQSFGHVEYDCPSQTVFIVDLNGHLRDIRGNLTIRSTNLKALRLSTTQRTVINVGGDLVIEGLSQVWFSTNSPDCVVNIGGDFVYRSAGSAATYLSTRGNVRLVIGGNMTIDAPGPLRTASSAADSTGARQSMVSLKGDFRLARGSIIAPPSGNGSCVIGFDGTTVQQVHIPRVATPLYGNLHYTVAPGARVALGESPLVSESGSLTVSGTLEIGSTDSGGAIQQGMAGGNIRVAGARNFAAGSELIYNGQARQVMGDAHPSVPHTIIDNVHGVSFSDEVHVQGDFTLLAGSVSQGGNALHVGGNVRLPDDQVVMENLVLTGSSNQVINANGAIITDVEISKSGGDVSLTSPLKLSGTLQLSRPAVFRSQGHLTLLSTGDDAGMSASVAALPASSAIVGDVTVERYMSGEGRIYRYLSSPVANATVASLMDDFPVTGAFDDPSEGPGIRSGNASLYEYDESLGEEQKGWRGYPLGGRASDAPLVPGRGYAAFIRNQSSTVVDFTGPINQGDIFVPMSYTVHNGTGNGWCLVGNPYPASIDWDAADLTKVALSRVIAIRDNGARRFRYWDGDDDGDIPGGRIAQGQSFWVRATGTGASLTFREGAKTVDAAFYRRSSVPVPSLIVSVSDGLLTDRAVVKLRPRSRDELDDWDGVKLLNDSLNVSTLLTEGSRLAIDSRPELPDSIPLSITELHPSRYFIRLVATGDLGVRDFFLVDRYRNRSFALHSGDSVEFEVTADRASAFTIFFRKPEMKLLFAERLDSIAVAMPSLHKNAAEPWRTTKSTPSPDDVLTRIQAYPNPVSSRLFVEGISPRGSSLQGVSPQDAVTCQGTDVEIYTASGLAVAKGQFNSYYESTCETHDGVSGANISTGGRTTFDRTGNKNQEGRAMKRRLVLEVTILPPGAYFARLSAGGRTVWVRFIKD